MRRYELLRRLYENKLNSFNGTPGQRSDIENTFSRVLARHQ
jgi:hypothetical protein